MTEENAAVDREVTQVKTPVDEDDGKAGDSSQVVADRQNLQLMLDVPLTLSAELGACTLTVQQVLRLSRGKVVELEKLAGEPLDILLNGRLIAHGEAVVVNERFGVRIVDIATPAERLSRMRS